MTNYKTQQIAARVTVSILLLSACVSRLVAQDSSLSKHPLPVTGDRPLLLEDVSFTYQKPTEARKFQKEDIVFVRVEIKAEVRSDATLKRDKDASIDATLLDWIRLDGLALKPAPQKDGDPKVAGELEEEYNAKGRFSQNDRIAFNIAARIVDIRPNAISCWNRTERFATTTKSGTHRSAALFDLRTLIKAT